MLKIDTESKNALTDLIRENIEAINALPTVPVCASKDDIQSIFPELIMFRFMALQSVMLTHKLILQSIEKIVQDWGFSGIIELQEKTQYDFNTVCPELTELRTEYETEICKAMLAGKL